MKIPIIKNTLTNYVSMAVRLVQGVLVTRWLLLYLGEEFYGLWSLLWSFFCYALLLDFGFGVTAQKYTSIGFYRSDIDKYNRIMSTIFSFHAIMALVILICTFAASCFVPQLFRLENAPVEKIEYCRRCFLVFGIGSALTFPSGIFPEIMVGLHKIYLRNYIMILSKLAELGGIVAIFSLGGELQTLIWFTVVLTAVTNFSMFFLIRREVPQFRLRLWIARESFREIFHFSGFVYLGSVARLLWGRGTLLLISMCCGLNDVAYFQLGGRLPNLMNQLTGPYQENVSPITATFYASGRHRALGRILVNSMRWNSFLSTGMMVAIFVYAGELMRFLFKVEEPMVLAICRWMVVSLYIGLVFRSIPERFLLMAERHKLLSWITIVEAAVNFVACIVLLQYFPIVCVVWAALFIKVFTTVFWVAPPMLRYLKNRMLPLLWQVSIKPLLATLPLILAAYWLKRSGWHDFGILAAGGSIGGIGYLACCYFFVLTPVERKFFRRKLPRGLFGRIGF